MEQVDLDQVRQQFDQQVRSRFPEGAIRQVAVLGYGDAPEVEPGQLLARVVVETPDDREGREQAFEALHHGHHAAFKELREELNKLPVPVVLQFLAGGERGEGEPRGPIIQLMGRRAGAGVADGPCGPDEAPGPALTPGHPRLPDCLGGIPTRGNPRPPPPCGRGLNVVLYVVNQQSTST